MNLAETNSREELARRVAAADWYHTIDLGDGLVTPGHYDHRQYLDKYGLPADLTGQTALDLGAASGFFSFELERRGARVTATDLPSWDAHDFGPAYTTNNTPEANESFLVEPFAIAQEALGSQVEKKFINIYDVSPETVGLHDFVFCGSMLIHLSDPIRALWKIASVTRHQAVISTVIKANEMERPIADLVGYRHADSWWEPSRRCLELMTAAAGFAGIEWYSDYRMDYSDGTPGPYHGVIHAYKTTEGWTDKTRASADVIEQQKQEIIAATEEAVSAAKLMHQITALQGEVARLQGEVAGYRNRKVIRLLDRLRGR